MLTRIRVVPGKAAGGTVKSTLTAAFEGTFRISSNGKSNCPFWL